MLHLFSVHFESVKFFCAHLVFNPACHMELTPPPCSLLLHISNPKLLIKITVTTFY